MKVPVYLVVFFSLLSITSCDREQAPDCFQRAGEVTTVTRSLESFHSVRITDLFEIELIDSSWSGVILTGPKNLLPDIETRLSNDELFIANRNTCNFMRRYDHLLKMKICAPAFPQVQNYGTGRIFTSDTLRGAFFQLENRSASGSVDLLLDVDSLVIASHTGVSDVALRGNARVAHYFNQGLGLFQAHEMNSVHVYANNSSIQNMSISCMGYLFARIDYSGNIYYSGSPVQIDLDARSNGQLLPMPN